MSKNPPIEVAMIPAGSITVPSDRQRDEYPQRHVADLAESIIKDGLFHAILVTDDLQLIAGFCRREAVMIINRPYMYGDIEVPAGHVPCVIRSNMTEELRARIELHENLKRKNLTPVQEARAIAKLHGMVTAERKAENLPETKAATVQALNEMTGKSATTGAVADAILIDSFGEDPDVIQAGTRADALRIAKKKLADQFSASLGQLAVVRNVDLDLRLGNCRTLFRDLLPGTISCVLSDPPYGVEADTFGDQSFALGHQYADTKEVALAVAETIFVESARVCKDDAHLYMFCDIRVWPDLCLLARAAGWTVYSTPLIWHKSSGHAPQVGFFSRRYECLLFAYRGGRTLHQTSSDVITLASVKEKIHAAQKPVDLYFHFLKLSCLPGETVLDPTCGSGTIFEAAKLAGLKAIGFESDEHMYNLAKQRISAL